MRKLFAILLLIGGAISFAHAAPKYTFASVKSGQNILSANDNYMNRMAPAEIAIRVFSPKADKTSDDLKSLYIANVLEWTNEEKSQIAALIESNTERLKSVNHLLPNEITFVKVNNKVEGGLPHTRGHAIILPAAKLPVTDNLFYHELFHVLSREQKAKHQSLYGLIGFQSCDFTPTQEIRKKSLTNPDVPAESYYLPVTINDKPSAIMSFLYASREAFDPTIEHGFSGHFGFGLLKVSTSKGQCTVDVDAQGKAQILDPSSVPEFFASIGKNTSYIIHPEEVLADNFVFLMTDKQDLPNPDIPNRLKAWLTPK